MNSAKNSIFMAWVGFILLVASSVAKADMASGTYNADMGDKAPVWDISGYYYSGDDEGWMDFTLTQSASGQITGTGSYVEDYYYYGYNRLDGVVTVEGSVKSSGTATTVAMTLKISGGGYIVVNYNGDTDEVAFTETVNFKFRLDDGAWVLCGPGSVRATVVDLDTGRRGSASQRLDYTEMALPDTATCRWGLTLNLIPDGKQYTGTATVLMESGTTINYTVAGNYSAKSDTSNLSLKGGTAGNLNLVVSTCDSTLSVRSLKGRVSGQNLKYRAP